MILPSSRRSGVPDVNLTTIAPANENQELRMPIGKAQLNKNNRPAQYGPTSKPHGKHGRNYPQASNVNVTNGSVFNAMIRSILNEYFIDRNRRSLVIYTRERNRVKAPDHVSRLFAVRTLAFNSSYPYRGNRSLRIPTHRTVDRQLFRLVDDRHH
jgi:hypothetical protein